MSIADRLGYELSRVGERFGIDALTYNPVIFRMYDRLAEKDAPIIMERLQTAFPEVKRVLDVGSGSGRFAAEARRRGLDVTAVEYSAAGRSHAQRLGIRAGRFDLAKTPAAALDDSFDLAYCFEVAEHVSTNLAHRLVEFLSRFPWVVFSAASPGQGGIGHVNEQPGKYWQEKFEARGMVVDSTAQDAFVRELPLERLSLHWAVTNIMIFRGASSDAGMNRAISG